MTINPIFSNQVRLLVSALPQVFKEDCFALKGGTAINLFIREMPRLSVDIDLTYLPVEPRDISLQTMDTALKRIGTNLEKYIPGAAVTANKIHGLPYCNRVQVVKDGALIKIEVSPVLRGSVFPTAIQSLSSPVEDMFGAAQMRLLNFLDLYGGKICAALDRQHPRDLFDIKFLLDNEGITEDLKDSFLVYLISHNRPIAELLAPSPKDISELYDREFSGMTFDEVSLDDLYNSRDTLLKQIHSTLNNTDKQFLLSFKSGKPDWTLFAIPDVRKLPAVRWKLENIQKMQAERRKEAYQKLQRALGS